MRQREFYHRWEWLLQANPQALWPLVSDTDRLNRNAGMPPVENRSGDEASLINARRRLRCFRLGVALEWEAEPYEWVRPYRFGVVCRYSRGPIAETHLLCFGWPCAPGGPVAQQLLPPGSQRTVTLPLEEGRYRLRTPGLPRCQLALVTTDGLPAATFRASAMGWSHEELCLAPVSTLRFDNATDSEQLFSLERMAWTDQAVTAAEVIALQRFRDLFANEVLRPGERISVGSLTLLFTDLCDSTRLYHTLGDAPAFGRVIDHFEILQGHRRGGGHGGEDYR